MMSSIFLFLIVALTPVSALLVPRQARVFDGKLGSSSVVFERKAPTSSSQLASAPGDGDESFVDSISSSVQKSIKIVQDSSASGSSFKQIIADLLAGEYDAVEVNANLDSLIASAPCVVFIWQASPFSKKAIAALEVAGADFKIVRLDDPWSEGNPLRAELGKRTGRPTVPSIWIGGEYVGGFDGGTGEDSPGIVDLAFRGTLRPKLEAAGALKKSGAKAGAAGES